MSIQNVPEIFLADDNRLPDPFVYDYKMADDLFRSKVNLSQHMFSFLQKGKKQVHFADSSVAVSSRQSLLIKKGNCLWSEMMDNDEIYYCKLLFFSEQKLRDFLQRHGQVDTGRGDALSYFIIENDPYIHSYLNALSSINSAPAILVENLLDVKFEELMLYLLNKYGRSFEAYLWSLVSSDLSPFQQTVENNMYSTLNVDEIAFLCHMSLSTFKRNFRKEYGTSPGKWLQDKRLHKAKMMLSQQGLKPSDIYLECGYNNLSNFSIAFKNKFGKSPSEV